MSSDAVNDAEDYYATMFDHKYLRWFHLLGQPALIEIIRTEKGVEMTLPGGAKDKKPLLHFRQIKGAIKEVKPLVLNVTNGNSLAEILGEKRSQWVGKQVVLFTDTTEAYDKKKKRMMPTKCVRIRASKAPQPGGGKSPPPDHTDLNQHHDIALSIDRRIELINSSADAQALKDEINRERDGGLTSDEADERLARIERMMKP